MAAALETEAKLELDRAGFDAIREAGSVHHVDDQLNVYYDNGWKLAERSATFRIRYLLGKQPVVTLKIPVRTQSGVRVSQEFELPFRMAIRSADGLGFPARELPLEQLDSADMRNALGDLGIDRLDRIGCARNRRCSLLLDGSLIELDELRLPNGKVVFEAEIEDPNSDLCLKMVERIRFIAPSARPSAESKFQRFRKAVVEMTMRSPARQRLRFANNEAFAIN